MGSGGKHIAVSAKKPVDFEHPTYIGVRDSIDPSGPDLSRAFAMENVYPLDPFVGAGIVGRPGFSLAGGQLTGAAPIRRITQFTRLDGTEYTVGFCNGEIYTYNWGTNAWSRVVTTANLTTASITLSAAARIYTNVFTNQLLVSDGVNNPFLWDGTSGAGGLTELTNCPALFGKPVVYYAKIMGIKASDPTTIVWSEENQPNTGYEAGGHNNAWQLGQTKQERLYTLIPTNVALYYQRERSTGAIWGPADADFKTTGTHEAVSQSVGSQSPGGWVQHGDKVFFPDTDARPQVLEVGGGIRSPGIWNMCREQVKLLAKDQLTHCESIWNPDLNLIQMGVATSGSTILNRTLNFQPETAEYVGLFKGYDFRSIAVVKDASSLPTIMHGQDTGYAFKHGRQDGTTWQDVTSAGAAAAIDHVLESATMGHDTRDVKVWDRLDLTFRLDATMSGVSFFLRTPSGLADTGLVWPGVTLPLWDSAVWDVDEWSDVDALEQHLALGLDGYGRWMRLRTLHSTINQRFGFIAMKAEAFVEGADLEAA